MNIHYSSPLSQCVGTSVRKCKLQLKDITEEEILTSLLSTFFLSSFIRKERICRELFSAALWRNVDFDREYH